jgi:hypothetical protein
MYIGEILTLRKNTSPPSSGSNNKPTKKVTEAGGKLSWFLGWFSL